MSEDRKRKRDKKPWQHANKKRYAQTLETGSVGLLLSLCGPPGKGISDGYRILNEWREEHAPAGAADAAESSGPPSLSVEQELEQELAVLAEEKTMAPRSRKSQKFYALDTGCKGIAFIATPGHDPRAIAHDVLSVVRRDRASKSRFIAKIFPATHVCPARQPAIKAAAEQMLAERFTGPDAPPTTFAVCYQARNCSNEDAKRDVVIPTVAGIATADGRHKVDLTAPEYTILVQIVKTMCCLAVVPDYEALRKYNMQTLGQSEEEEAAAAQKAAARKAEASAGKEGAAQPNDEAAGTTE